MQPTAQAVGEKWKWNELRRGERVILTQTLQPPWSHFLRHEFFRSLFSRAANRSLKPIRLQPLREASFPGMSFLLVRRDRHHISWEREGTGAYRIVGAFRDDQCRESDHYRPTGSGGL